MAARVALVAGATGLVGRAVLARLLADKRWSSVHVAGRRAPDVSHPKLVVHLLDTHTGFGGFTSASVDDVFIALGTTIKTAGSREAFRAVDVDAVVAVARAAHAAGATRLALVSAMGADPDSAIFYNRTKGEAEAAISALGYASVVVARPSLLLGDRRALQQPERRAEAWASRLVHRLAPLIRLLPRNTQPVQASDVAAALIDTLADAPPGTRMLLSGDLHAAN
ncbi:MAG: NAD-dependent epimerase/dehydratase family protein [Polaromonas sp.]|nr:NAD-dependent epimerase/dehydratase family protein [Polaromonas sp.]